MLVFYPQVSVLSAADVDFGINSFIASVLAEDAPASTFEGATVLDADGNAAQEDSAVATGMNCFFW